MQYIVSGLSLLLVNYDSFLPYINSLGYDRGSTQVLGKKDGTKYEGLDIYRAIEFAKGNSEFNLGFLKDQVILMCIEIRDKLKDFFYSETAPEFEFLRHICNAAAHCNKFHFKGDEPKFEAKFKNFEINQSLEGKECILGCILPGDFLELLDFVRSELRRNLSTWYNITELL
ncbi:hypothetical protein GF389_00145 [Candidatus Dojkabacteria bacterium]|nr:hypothetical protein [Candidatus Dojkabacteria bacterium]